MDYVIVPIGHTSIIPFGWAWVFAGIAVIGAIICYWGYRGNRCPDEIRPHQKTFQKAGTFILIPALLLTAILGIKNGSYYSMHGSEGRYPISTEMMKEQLKDYYGASSDSSYIMEDFKLHPLEDGDNSKRTSSIKVNNKEYHICSVTYDHPNIPNFEWFHQHTVTAHLTVSCEFDEHWKEMNHPVRPQPE